MTNKNDGPGQGPPKPVSEAAPKKPSAIIDLRPTEVEIKDAGKAPAAALPAGPTAPAAGAGKPERTPAGGSVPATGPAGAAGAASSAASPTPAAQPSGGTSTGQPTAGKPTEPPRPSSSESRSGTAAPPAARGHGGGLRQVATHLGAGLVGGLLALLGADSLGDSLGLAGTGSSQVVQGGELDRRLRALESATRQAAQPSDLGQRIAAAESRLAALDTIGRRVEEIGKGQSHLAGETRSLADKLAGAGTDADAATRLARLEEILRTLSDAAQSDPQAGRIPQLAAVAGKLTDLEASVAAQLAQLRKSLTQEVDSRLTQSTEASEAARSGTLRLDRDLAAVKTEAARLAQRIEGLKSSSDKTELAVEGLRADAKRLESELARQLSSVARPQDVSAAMAPVTSRLSALEASVQSVVKSEEDRRTNAERIVLAIELGNLKRAVERGVPFAAELAEVRRAGGPKLELAALERHKERGVPAVQELQREFRSIAHAIIEAEAEPENAHWTDRLLASAKSVVRVRRTNQGADDASAEAAVARIEASLKDGKLGEAVAEARKLKPKPLAAARDWLDKLEARAAVERAIVDTEAELKAALSGRREADRKG